MTWENIYLPGYHLFWSITSGLFISDRICGWQKVRQDILLLFNNTLIYVPPFTSSNDLLTMSDRIANSSDRSTCRHLGDFPMYSMHHGLVLVSSTVTEVEHKSIVSHTSDDPHPRLLPNCLQKPARCDTLEANKTRAGQEVMSDLPNQGTWTVYCISFVIISQWKYMV